MRTTAAATAYASIPVGLVLFSSLLRVPVRVCAFSFVPCPKSITHLRRFPSLLRGPASFSQILPAYNSYWFAKRMNDDKSSVAVQGVGPTGTQESDANPKGDSNPKQTKEGDTNPDEKNKRRNRRRNRGKGGNRTESEGGNDNLAKDDGKGAGAPNDNKKGGGRVANSYLKVLLDEASINILYGMGQIIRDRVRDRFDLPAEQQEQEKEETQSRESEKKVEADDKVTPEEKGSKSKKRQKRPLTFKPRSRGSLHMTFFFGGTILCEISAEELQEWHGKVMSRLKETTICADTSSNDDQQKCEADAYTLQFKELCLFPPRRNSLIVAIFDASPSLHQLHDDLRAIAKDGESEMIASVVQRSKKKWTAHITIGNLYGGQKADVKELGAMLNDGLEMAALSDKSVSTTTTNTISSWTDDDTKVVDGSSSGNEAEGLHEPVSFSFTAKARGVTMGGPVPEQAELDWDFCFDGESQT